MTQTQPVASCLNCNESLSVTHKGPCPKCGHVGKQIKVIINEGPITVTDRITVDQKGTRREEHPKLNALLIGILIASPIVGYFINPVLGMISGFIFGGASFVIGQYAATKVKIHYRYEK